MWDTEIYNCSSMFYMCSAKKIDFSEFDSKNVVDMSKLFYGDYTLEEVILNNLNTSNVKNMESMFYGCSKIKYIDLSHFDLTQVTSMNSMFQTCSALTSVNLFQIKTSELLDMSKMFYSCSKLESLDLSYFDTSKVTSLSDLFRSCSVIKEINLTNFKTSSVVTVNKIFNSCDKILSLDLSSFDLSNVINAGSMFEACNALREIKFSQLYKMSKVNTTESMFRNCKNLISLDLSFIDSPNIKLINYMFGNCNNLKYLNMPNFKISSVISAYYFFDNNYLLKYLNAYSLTNNDVVVNSLFEKLPENVTYCINEQATYIVSVLNGKNGVNNCSKICNVLQQKSNPNNPSKCYSSCTHDETYIYEYDNECHEQCPDNTVSTGLDKICKIPVENVDTTINIPEISTEVEVEEDTNVKELGSKEITNEEYNEETNKGSHLKETTSNIIKQSSNELYSSSFYTEIRENSYISKESINILTENTNSNINSNSDYTDNDNNSKNIYEDVTEKAELDIKTSEIDIKNYSETIQFKNSSLIYNDCNIIDFLDNLCEIKEISKYLSSFINSSSIIKGDDFNALFFSSNDMNIKVQLDSGISAIYLDNCNDVIKNHYNISSEEDLIVLIIESINNKSRDINNSFNLGKSIQVKLYDNSGRQLDLSVCKEDIKVLMNLEGVKELDIETSKKYAKQGIDVFNASDNFFNDLCHKYDNLDEMDIIIDDRRKDIYQNVTFCQDGCFYDGVDYDLMAANCLCHSTSLQNGDNVDVDNDNKQEKEVLNFKTITKSFISNLLDFNIEVIFCYNLVFDTKILFKNIGFYCMISLNFLQIIFLIVFLIKKLKPIETFMHNASENKNQNAYPPKKNNIKNKNDETNIETENKNKNGKKNNQRKKNYNKDSSNIKSISQLKLMKSKNIRNNNNLIPQDNSTKLDDILNATNKQSKKQLFLYKEKNEDNVHNLIFNNKNSNEIVTKIKTKKKLYKKRKGKKGKINLMETIGENEDKKNKPFIIGEIQDLSKTEDEIEEMDYEEAIIYDKRSYLKMYWSSLVDSQIILDTFFTSNNLNLFIIKLSFFIIIFEISFFLNALFYTDEYISDAYHNNGVLDFVSGLPKAIYSFLATLLLTNLLKMLSNSKSELMKLIRENSKDKDYIHLINANLKKLKIKLIIYFILIFILGLLFLYYVSAFCAVYRYSQKYWFYGCLESFGMDFLVAFFISLLLSLLKFIAIRKRIKCLFTLSNIFGIFL